MPHLSLRLAALHLAAPLLVTLVACSPGDDDADADDTGTTSASGTASASGSASASASATASASASAGDTTAGDGELGPAARVRFVNAVPDASFDAWVADVDGAPVRVAENIGFGEVSDYLDAPLNPFSQWPEMVLMPSGEAPQNTPNWRLDNVSGPDRIFLEVRELDAEGEQASLIVTRDEVLQWQTLDETEIADADPSQATLHISYNLFDLEGPQVSALAVVGQPCLHVGSTSVALPWSVPPGSFELGYYDVQTDGECTNALQTLPITAAAGERVLVVLYHDDAEVLMLETPIPLDP
ncbi:MAG: DUF4397 domain-containing protein [Deltaproteobacteria bacterium]|nr:DUF4397 domain-containing protein [Deltaproteobacteria bacterium]